MIKDLIDPRKDEEKTLDKGPIQELCLLLYQGNCYLVPLRERKVSQNICPRPSSRHFSFIQEPYSRRELLAKAKGITQVY